MKLLPTTSVAKPPKAAPKRGPNLTLLLKVARLFFIGKSVDEIALILDKCPRVIRRKLDKLKDYLKSTKAQQVSFNMAVNDLAFTCKDEHHDYINQSR